MPYLIGIGHDVVLEDLDPIVPQPATPGMLFGRRSYAASGIVIDEMPYVPFEFSTIKSATQYQSILTQFGLMTALTAEVTVYVQDRNYDWVLRNGLAVAPEIGTDGQRSQYFLRDFTILVKNLAVQA